MNDRSCINTRLAIQYLRELLGFLSPQHELYLTYDVIPVDEMRQPHFSTMMEESAQVPSRPVLEESETVKLSVGET